METTKTETTKPETKVVDAAKAEVLQGEVVTPTDEKLAVVTPPAPAIVEAPTTAIATSTRPIGTIRLRTSHPQVLKQAALAAGALIDEIYLTKETLSEMDESHICLMTMNHGALWDAEYTWTPDAAKQLGINLEDFLKILGAAITKHTTYIEVIQDEMDASKLVIKTNNARYRLRLVEIDEKKVPPTPELDVQFDVSGTIDPSELRDALKGVEIFQDTAQIVLDPKAGKAIISAEGEVGDVAIDVPLSNVESERGKPARGVFSLAFLKNILKAKISEMRLSLAENAPLRAAATILVSAQTYKVPDGKGGLKEVKSPATGRKVKLVYFLAPRIEEEESYESD